jgi:hypothetical protein
VGTSSGVNTTTGYPLTPGEPISFGIENLSGLWIYGTITDRVAYAGS